ncbi:hypothetical protein [Bacillus sp. AFS040349]|uniref:hypothetical protein n=1 Tax=Bacillus sp. AFS040349 TaxID=2033502 RepID=UPI000BFE9011|nr:hypothetical protein [Bacillus sp. AFS040349]PGT83260.1 hypothetical protein COD11_13070 [Bacillus sp. AFS040349]
MSYAAVKLLSQNSLDNAFYEFKSKEEREQFKLPFYNLKINDKVSIKGCKKLWIVCNTNNGNEFYSCGKYHVHGNITINDEKGYYASIRREDIEKIIKDKEDEDLFYNNGQLAFSF